MNLSGKYFGDVLSMQDRDYAIIDRGIWNAVKEKLDTEAKKRAQDIYPVGSNAHFLYGKVFCDICGEPCTRITVTMKPHRQYKAWRCRGRAKKNGCTNPQVREDELLIAITAVFGTDEFDRDIFDNSVEKVLVTDDGLRVVLYE